MVSSPFSGEQGFRCQLRVPPGQLENKEFHHSPFLKVVTDGSEGDISIPKGQTLTWSLQKKDDGQYVLKAKLMVKVENSSGNLLEVIPQSTCSLSEICQVPARQELSSSRDAATSLDKMWNKPIEYLKSRNSTPLPLSTNQNLQYPTKGVHLKLGVSPEPSPNTTPNITPNDFLNVIPPLDLENLIVDDATLDMDRNVDQDSGVHMRLGVEAAHDSTPDFTPYATPNQIPEVGLHYLTSEETISDVGSQMEYCELHPNLLSSYENQPTQTKKNDVENSMVPEVTGSNYNHNIFENENQYQQSVLQNKQKKPYDQLESTMWILLELLGCLVVYLFLHCSLFSDSCIRTFQLPAQVSFVISVALSSFMTLVLWGILSWFERQNFISNLLLKFNTFERGLVETAFVCFQAEKHALYDIIANFVEIALCFKALSIDEQNSYYLGSFSTKLVVPLLASAPSLSHLFCIASKRTLALNYREQLICTKRVYTSMLFLFYALSVGRHALNVSNVALLMWLVSRDVGCAIRTGYSLLFDVLNWPIYSIFFGPRVLGVSGFFGGLISICLFSLGTETIVYLIEKAYRNKFIAINPELFGGVNNNNINSQTS